MATTLQRELDTFRRELPGLLAVEGNRGRYVLISGDVVAGVYPTFEAGVEAGYDRFGFQRFMVKEITDNEVPRFFPRSLTKCP